MSTKNKEFLQAISEAADAGELTQAMVQAIGAKFFGGDTTPLYDPGSDSASARYADYWAKGSQPAESRLELFSRVDLAKDRATRYKQFTDIVEKIPEVRRALEIYADYVASGSSIEMIAGERHKSKVYAVSFAGESAKLYADELEEVDQRLKLPYQAWDICYNFIGWGDDFIENVYNDDGIVRIQRLPRETVSRMEMQDGRLDPDYPFQQNANYGTKKTKFAGFQMNHFRMAADLQPGYGESILASLVPTANEISLIEAALTVGRLEKAHRRLIYTVNVGDMTGKAADAYLEATKNKITKRRWFNPNTGSVEVGRNPLQEEEDIFIATGNHLQGNLAGIHALPGDSSISYINDVVHKYNRLLAGMRMPQVWLGITGPNVRNVMDEQVLSFMRSCRRIREYFERALTDLYFYALASYGMSVEWLKHQSLKYEWPSMTHSDDEMFIGIQSRRATLAQQYKSLDMIPDDAILMAALGYDEERAKEMSERIIEQRKRAIEFANTYGVQLNIPKEPVTSENSRDVADKIMRYAETDESLQSGLDSLKDSVSEVLGIVREWKLSSSGLYIPRSGFGVSA